MSRCHLSHIVLVIRYTVMKVRGTCLRAVSPESGVADAVTVRELCDV